MHFSPLGVPATFDFCSLGTSPAADAVERAMEGEESEGAKVSAKGSGKTDEVAGARGRESRADDDDLKATFQVSTLTQAQPGPDRRTWATSWIRWTVTRLRG